MVIASEEEFQIFIEDFSYSNYYNLKKDKNVIKTSLVPFIISNSKFFKYVNEYWTSKQRQSSSIHEISYRACFKANLPRFFIKLLTRPEDIVYDPFAGRGTTGLEAGLLGRKIILNDVNPLSLALYYPRFFVLEAEEIMNRLDLLTYDYTLTADIDLSMFFHKQTENEIVALKHYLNKRQSNNEEDVIDKWIRMVATNRLTGHSKGFFSVYTLPPNQAVSPNRQKEINRKRKQIPDYRDIKSRIIKKTKSLVRNVSEEERINLFRAGETGLFLTEKAQNTTEIKNESVQLTVTSPPFLDVVQYSKDNWLRCWFNNIDDNEVSKNITVTKSLDEWKTVMKGVFKELYRITKHGGWVAFEVGEVKKGTLKLEEYVVPLGLEAGFNCVGVLINMQKFTKTANIWGIKSNIKGTNTNRVVIFRKK